MAAGPPSTTFILPTATGAQDLDRCLACESPFASSHSTAHPILLPNCGCIYHTGCLVRVFAAQLALPPHHCLCPTCSIDGMVTHAFIHVAPGSSPDQIRLEATLYAEWDVLILRVAFPPVPLPRRPEVEPLTPPADASKPSAERQVSEVSQLVFQPAPGSQQPLPAAATTFTLSFHPGRLEDAEPCDGEEGASG